MVVKVLLILMFLATTAHAQPRGGTPATLWMEVDGAPSGRARTIIVTPDSLSFTGNQMSLDILGSNTINTTYLRLNCSNDPLTEPLDIRKLNGESRLHLESFSGNAARYSRLRLRKSDHVSVLSQTNSGDWLGIIQFAGCNTIPDFAYGSRIYSIQSDTSGAFVPSNLYFEASDAGGGHTKQLVLAESGYVGIGRDNPAVSLDVIGGFSADSASIIENAHIGSATSWDVFYSDTGDIVASGEMFVGGGINVVADKYGVGLQIREYDPEKTLVYDIDATFTAATATIEKIGETFESDGVMVNDFLAVTGANDTTYIGATGEIIGVTETTIIVSVAAAGSDIPSDLTDFNFVVYNHPIASILDNGDTHFLVGPSCDASFKIIAAASCNDHAIHYDVTSGADGNAAVEIEHDADTYEGTSTIRIDYDASGFVTADNMSAITDIIIDNTAPDAEGGMIHGMDIAVADPTALTIDIVAVATNPGVDVIHQHLGTPAILGAGYLVSGLVTTDVVVALSHDDVDVELFTADDDYLYIGVKEKFDQINNILSTDSSQNIIPIFEYSLTDATGWVPFTPADDTSGYQNSGTIRFASEALTNWGAADADEAVGVVEAPPLSYHWIRIQRTRNLVVTPPVESTIRVTELGTFFGWDMDGNISSDTLSVTDGITIPPQQSGFAIIYVDTNDGDLKVKFSNGFVATIANDS